MPTIKRITSSEVVAALPEWSSLSEMPATQGFICAAGFEERGRVALARWLHVKGNGRLVIALRYPLNRDDNAPAEKWIEQAAAAAAVPVKWIDYNRIQAAADLAKVLTEADIRSVVVDVSSMASFALYPCISSVLLTRTIEGVWIVYTEAEEYFPTQLEWSAFQEKTQGMDMLEKARCFDESHFLSRGVDSIYEPLGFEGVNRDNLPGKLVIVPNFAFERINRMIDYARERYGNITADQTWIIGKPPNTEKHGWRYDALWKMYDEPKNAVAVSTFDYKSMMIALEDVWRLSRSGQSLVVVTAGSKAQHLGTVLFHIMHKEVCVILSEPQEFTASRYSTRAGSQWIIRLPQNTVEQLARAGCFEFSWDDSKGGMIVG